MKIAVVGAGALGSAVGGLLSAHHHVTLIGRREHAEAITAHGLSMTGQMEKLFRPRAVDSVDGLEVQDIVLITTKAYDTEAAAAIATRLVDEDTAVTSLQNGLGNGEVLVRHYGERAVVGVPYLGATYLGPGQVRLAGLSEVVLGPAAGDADRASVVAKALSDAGIPSRAVDDITPTVWLKVIVNASINPLTALVRKENGHLLASEGLLKVSRSACHEGSAAAAACDIDLGISDPFVKVQEVLRTTASNRSSMLQDVERSRRTEIDQINGALVMRGEARGVPMPVNRALWEMVRALEC